VGRAQHWAVVLVEASAPELHRPRWLVAARRPHLQNAPCRRDLVALRHGPHEALPRRLQLSVKRLPPLKMMEVAGNTLCASLMDFRDGLLMQAPYAYTHCARERGCMHERACNRLCGRGVLINLSAHTVNAQTRPCERTA
jgi:hypothetical protein